MESNTEYILKIIIKSILGIGISILFFMLLIVFLFSPERSILIPILLITYTSIIIFIIMWNKNRTKGIYLLLFVPLICFISIMIVTAYYDNIRQIESVNEQVYNLHQYIPFKDNNLVATLDEEPFLKITENLPILDGATALFPVYSSFVQAVYPEGIYDIYKGPIFCSKTDKAFENLLEYKVDIIFCAEPSKAQLQMFHDRDQIVKIVPIGKEAFVFFVNKTNPVSNLSVDVIKGIYSGKIKNWKEINGNPQKIKAFQRPKNSGSQTIMEKIMYSTPIMKPSRENLPHGMGDIINEVAVYRNFSNAIGYSFLYFSTEMVKNNRIKLLSINEVYPSKESIQNNSYPFSYDFYAIYVDRDEKNENIELLIEWILSKQGQELIKKTGYVSLQNY